MFFLSYTTIYLCLYFSEYDLQMSLCDFWLKKRPSIKYVRKCAVCTCVQGKGCHAYVYVRTVCYSVLFYLLKVNLTFIQKRCVRQKRLFFSNEINFCRHEVSFFHLKLFLLLKLAKTLLILMK